MYLGVLYGKLMVCRINNTASIRNCLVWIFLNLALIIFVAGCGGSNAIGISSKGPTSIAITSNPDFLITGTTKRFYASVTGEGDLSVEWSVSEGGGSINSLGDYTAPNSPALVTLTAVASGNKSIVATISFKVIYGNGAKYDVGVNYHRTTGDLNSAFISVYNNATIRQKVRSQLQDIADHGATFVTTHLWLVDDSGTDYAQGAWRLTFPLSPQEQANIRAYANDVAKIVGKRGNRLRLNIALAWLGYADYKIGSPSNGIGSAGLSASEYSRRVNASVDALLSSIKGINYDDGTPVVDIVYLDIEVMIAAPGEKSPKPNAEWFLAQFYPRFVQIFTQAGFSASIYFNISQTQDNYLTPGYLDSVYSELNNHKSMFWLYRTLRYMKDNSLQIPKRIDFSFYTPTDLPLKAGNTYSLLIKRALDDADSVLSNLNINSNYGIAETYYFTDSNDRRALGQALAAEAISRQRLQSVSIWPWDGLNLKGPGVEPPYFLEDYLP